jgi:hypothetical protein
LHLDVLLFLFICPCVENGTDSAPTQFLRDVIIELLPPSVVKEAGGRRRSATMDLLALASQHGVAARVDAAVKAADGAVVQREMYRVPIQSLATLLLEAKCVRPVYFCQDPA